MGLVFAGKTSITDQDSANHYTLAFDANVSEVDTFSATVTDHPVEDGANVSDHIRDDPDEIQIDAIFTRTPVETLGLVISEVSTRAETMWQGLKQIFKNHSPVTVNTTVDNYPDMLITSLSRKRSATTGETVSFSLRCKHIVKVQSSEVEAPKRPAGVQTPKKSVGTVTPTAAPQTSATLGLVKMVGGLFGG
jgi:hypothetical protein